MCMLATVSLFGQKVSGVVMDGNEGLIGASVAFEGTTIGTVTDLDGSFMLNGDGSSDALVISYIGYEDMVVAIDPNSSMVDLGNLVMSAASLGLEEVVITGVIDLVKDRETPVAVSTIRAEEIQLKLGNQEFPEIMKSTPSVYATKQGGGYGDSRINVRGFNQRNIAVIINGQPVNDMENGWVYWSNWAGLQDIASGVEIQRGIGASKLAVPSVGGTINIVTKASEREKGGFVSVGVGNDGYLKTTASVSTGESENGWSASALLGRWQGNGYVDGTKGEGYNYLAALGYRPSDNHSFNLTYTGASQWHHQRDLRLSIYDYEKYGGDDYRRFNADWGMRDGKEFTFRRNFYNKPIATLNHDWNIANGLTLSTALYGSWGRGGGTGPRGKNYGIYPYKQDLTSAIAQEKLPYRTTDGLIDFDAIIANNKSGDKYTGDTRYMDGKIIGSNGFSDDGVNSNVAIRRSSVNSHNWYGVISNLEYDLDKFTFGLGLDGRTYTGLHYRVLNDLMGLDGYYSTGSKFRQGIVTTTSKANPWADISSSDKIDYFNVGKVDWLGVNGLVEYKGGDISAVLQGGVSQQGYKRIDYFDQYPAESKRHTMPGGFIKGGLNYNLDANNNVFANAGYISKQPLFDAIFPRYGNAVNESAENQTITSFELGYGYRGNGLRANLNGYYTTWDNRFISRGVDLGGGQEGTANFAGIGNVHMGVELELDYDVTDALSLSAMASIGDWRYNSDFSATVFDENQNKIGTSTLYLTDVKVGDAAQTTLNIGADYEIIKGLSIDANWLYFDNLYADFGIADDSFLEKSNKGAVKLPGYNLFDAGITYKFDLGSQFLTLRANMNNIADTEYISESNTNIHASENAADNANGINKANQVWYGFGRTWNVSAKYSF